MSEIANPISAPKIQSRRCLGCRLPQELQEEIARDRFRGWATFAHLVQKLSSKGFNLSDSAVRRHFRHVPRDRYFEAAETENDNSQDVTTPFDALVNAQVLDDRQFKLLRVDLQYTSRKEPVLTGIKRISKPGLRVYTKAAAIPRVYGGLGLAVVSTPKGVMSGQQARRLKLGGEIICHVW